MQLELEPDVISGKDVLEVSDLAKSYDGRKLFEHLSFQIQRGDRIALLGDNGTGKTTILKSSTAWWRRTPEAFGWERMSPSAITIRNSRIFRGRRPF
mgnify:CR=1 FL=1